MKLLLILTLSLLASCRFLLTDIFEVRSHSPSETAITDTSLKVVSLDFSTDAEQTSLEEAFSFTSEGVEIPGQFQWHNARSLSYRLLHPIEGGKVYTIKVSAQAEDINGNSLKREFIHSFSTKKTEGRPNLIRVEPENHSDIDDVNQKIVLHFDKGMTPSSISDNFTISPSVPGYFSWDSEKRIFSFNPASPYEWQKTYSLTLNAATEDSDSWTLGVEHNWSFYMGSDKSAPEILLVSDETETHSITRDNTDDNQLTITGNWEKNRNVLLQFSEAMNRDSVEAALKIAPEAAFSLSWTSSNQKDRLLISWDEFLVYNTIYSITISESAKDAHGNSLPSRNAYHFQSNGSGSKPPRLMKLVYTKEAKTNPLRQVVLFDRETPANTKTEFRFSDDDEAADGSPLKVYFDYYFDLANSAYIDRFSFMENFAILPQSSSLTFTPVNIIAQYSSTVPNYKGQPALSNGYVLVRLFGDMNDSTTATGMVDFKIYTDFKDTLGNTMSEEWYRQIYDRDN